jgi:hypothetical protein
MELPLSLAEPLITNEAVSVDTESLRALAYLVQNDLSGASTMDDARLSIYLIEQTLIEQYAIVRKPELDSYERRGSRCPQEYLTTLNLTLSDAKDCDMENDPRRYAIIPRPEMFSGQLWINVRSGSKHISGSRDQFSAETAVRYRKRSHWYIESDKMVVVLSPNDVLLNRIGVTGFFQPTLYRTDDPANWNAPWNVPSRLKPIIRQNASQYLKGNVLTTRGAKDMINNGRDNP